MSVTLVPQQVVWLEASHVVKLTRRPTLAACLPLPRRCLLWPVFGALGARFPSEKWVPHRGLGKTSSFSLCRFLCDKIETFHLKTLSSELLSLSGPPRPQLELRGQRVMKSRATELFHPPGVEGVRNPSLTGLFSLWSSQAQCIIAMQHY